MRLRTLGLLAALALLPSSAAAPVVVVGPGARSAVSNDPFIGSVPAPAPPARALAAAASASGPLHPGGRGRPRPRPITVAGELLRLLRAHALSSSAYSHYVSTWSAALAAERRLRGRRAAELSAVTSSIHDIAPAGTMTPSRLPALFLTVERNRQYWTSGPLPAAGTRVEFAGSQLVWEYYRGPGIQLQVLGTFGRANGLFTAGAAQYSAMRQLLDEMVPLAARRAGALAWEYYLVSAAARRR